MVIGDKTRLQSVLINLTKNSLKFTLGEGDISIMTAYDKTKQLLNVHLKYTSTGGNAEDRNNLMSMFNSADQTGPIGKYLGESIGL